MKRGERGTIYFQVNVEGLAGIREKETHSWSEIVGIFMVSCFLEGRCGGRASPVNRCRSRCSRRYVVGVGWREAKLVRIINW